MNLDAHSSRLPKPWPAILAAVFFLSACGGGSSGSESTANPPDAGSGDSGDPTSGIDRGGVAFGEITGFGSIIVGGVRYDTDDAVITLDGSPATQAQLKVGDVATIVGAIDDDTGELAAQRVIVDEVLEARVETIDLAAGTFTALGQSVRITANTLFDDDFSPRSLEGVAIGDFLEVNGFIDADGRIVATRIERETDEDDFEVVGFISGLDTAARSFEINDLRVDYSAASLDDDFPPGGPADGDLVEVEGDFFESGTLIADELEYRGNPARLACDDFGDDDCDVEIEGFITRVDSASSSALNGIPVTVSSATQFEDGSAANIVVNARVEVEGVLDANGVLLAESIEFEDDNAPIEIEAPVQSVDLQSGVITLLGIRVLLDDRTRFDDFSSTVTFPFGPGDISAGDYLEVNARLYDGSEADVVATKIEREDFDSEVELRAFIDSLDAPDLVALGVSVQTTQDTGFEVDDIDVSQAEFFSAAAVGDLVDIEGAQIAESTILADEVELGEDFDDDDDSDDTDDTDDD